MKQETHHDELQRRIRELEQNAEAWEQERNQLKQAQDRLYQILRATSIPTFVIDQDHVLTHVNRAFENLTGLSARDIIGTRKQWMAFYPNERPTLADLVVDQASEKQMAAFYGDKIQRSEVVEGAYESDGLFRHMKSGARWLFFTASPLKDAEGRLIGAIETLQDITQKKKTEHALRKSEKRLRTLLDFIPYPIVVFSLEGLVYYLNPAFTEIFGWTLEELEGKTIPYIPPELEGELGEAIQKLFQEKVILRFETRRLTKDGRRLDVVMRAALYTETNNEPAGELVILRDISREKKIARTNEAILRISTALPEYPDLEDLLDYVSQEIRELLDAEGGLVILVDHDRNELFFKGAAYDDKTTEKRIKDVRIPMDKSVAGKVVKTGQPIIVPDTSKEPSFYPGVDEKIGYHTRNLVEVPLKSADRIIGALCARNKKNGQFDETDVDLLHIIASTVALSIENARFAEEILKAYKINKALLRISMALPKYPDLEELLDYVSNEVKRIVDSEGALVILLDEETQELYFMGAAYDDTATQERIKEIRFPIDELVAGRVIRSGEPLIVSDTSVDSSLHEKRDQKLGYHTRSLLLMPLRSTDRIIGVLCAINKREGHFDQGNVEILNLVAGTVALSIENARFSEELKVAYREVSSMNRAKDKVINHLSHELKTPVSVLSGSLSILGRHLEACPESGWKNAMARGKRNLERITDIQNQVEDILRERDYRPHQLLSLILDHCSDDLESILEQKFGAGPHVDLVRNQIDELFGPREAVPVRVHLDQFVANRLEALKPLFLHREVEILHRLEPVHPILIPQEVLRKVVDGLIKNAVENTPDEGKMEIQVKGDEGGVDLMVHDYGVGIVEDARNRIFEGFFSTQDTMAYSSKRVFDFNAGGKGADLLRMKVFSERFQFRIRMESTRCRFIPEEKDVCPGRISKCAFCTRKEDCYGSGGTLFFLRFKRAAD